MGEKERDVLITTLPRKLSHVRQGEKKRERGAPHRILKMNTRETLKHNEPAARVTLKKHLSAVRRF